MARMFGTDGVRGIANEELTPLLAMQLGQAGAYVLTKENEHKPTIMVGCDTRISGDMLANALMAGACSVGANCIYVGVIPTPAVAYLTKKYKVDAGVVISASHNPVEFNGIKFFDGNGYKLPDAMEDGHVQLRRTLHPRTAAEGQADRRFLHLHRGGRQPRCRAEECHPQHHERLNLKYQNTHSTKRRCGCFCISGRHRCP